MEKPPPRKTSRERANVSDHKRSRSLTSAQLSAHERSQALTSAHERSSNPERFSVTIEEAARRFADAGTPRAIPTIRRYCGNGILECARADTKTSEKWMIDPGSIERRVTELKQIGVSDERSPALTSAHERSESAPQPPEELARLRNENNELEKENRNLRIDLAVRNQLIDRFDSDRALFISDLKETNRRIGELEATLRLAPPKEQPRAEENAPAVNYPHQENAEANVHQVELNHTENHGE